VTSPAPIVYIDGARVSRSMTSGPGVGGQNTSRLNDLNPDEIESIDLEADHEDEVTEPRSAHKKPETKEAETGAEQNETNTASSGEQVKPDQEPEPPAGAPEPPPSRDTDNRAGRDVTYAEGDIWVDNSVRNYHQAINAFTERAQYAADREAVDRDMAKVVPPDETSEYLKALEDTRILVLTGGLRTGLTTAARYCWSEFARKHALDMKVLAPDDAPHLKRAVESGADSDVQLLDASRDRALSEEIPHLLPKLRDALHDNGGHLVIAIGEQFRTTAAHELPDSVFALGRPAPRAVLRSYLGDDFDITLLLAEPRFAAALDGYWPPRVKKLAAMIEEEGPDLDIDQFIQDFERQLEDWAGDLKELIEELDPDGRALLVSAAAIEGMPSTMIAQAADWFKEEVEFDESVPGMLAQQSLIKRLEPLTTVFRADGTSSKFTERHYGESLLRLLWNEFPSWRDAMSSLFDRLLSPYAALDDTQTTRMLNRLFEISSESGDAALIIARAANMVLRPTRKERRDLAGKMLLAAAMDPALGRQTRYQLWSWAYSCNSLPRTLQLTIAETCGDDQYARHHPDNAIRRLKHLVNSEFDIIRSVALDNMVKIALDLPWPSLLEHLEDWAGHSRDRLQEAVPDLVVRLLGEDGTSRRLKVSPGVIDTGRERAEQFWQQLAATASPADIRKVVGAWLALAAKLPAPDAEFLTDLLATAAAGDIRTMGQLLHATSPSTSTAHSSTERIQALREHLRTKLTRLEVPQT
jgi:hypothetical protein